MGGDIQHTLRVRNILIPFLSCKRTAIWNRFQEVEV